MYKRQALYEPLREFLGQSNTEFGMSASLFGLLSMILYIPGGWIADRISHKVLFTVSAIGCGILGFWFSTAPSFTAVMVIHGLWAITNIGLFWPAMTKAIALLEDGKGQGKMFGLFEGVRGVFVLVMWIGLMKVFEYLGGMKMVIIAMSIMSIICGIVSFFFMQGIRRGMWSVSWFKEVLGKPWNDLAENENTCVEQLLEDEAMKLSAGSDGLITVPEFLSPNNIPYRKAYMIGFDGRHKRAHMYRSILESIAMTMHMSMEDMFEEMGYKPERLIISGGGSKSKLFMQIFADVFGMPTVRNDVTDAAGVGAAICAAVGVKAYDTVEEAVSKMVRIKDEFQPNLENTAVYVRVENEVYRTIKKYSDPVNESIYNIFG